MKAFTIGLLVVVFLAAPALAGDVMSDWANSDSYIEKVPGMIIRGTANAVVSPFDVLMGPVKEYQDNPSWAIPVTGLLRGFQDGLDRLGRAAFDVGGSIFPKFNGFANYKPCPLTGMSLGKPAGGGGTA
ncbi:MAG: hypothetical protein HY587_01540 [Candidatus Omnitrophica bacterium]|nr:hypothetical protein [Candidatus Omnitrophota bacterium]